ncbi:hypothetical protein ACR78Z_10740 [Sphingobacterium thalpophilum]|uniref:hypothetical protein n=1 Tax=Sphingobacterium thalpophilum TaxID=259 RepID=UPI003DA45EDA
MMLNVANRDAKSLKNNNQWLISHPSRSLFFKDLTEIWVLHLEHVYSNEFGLLVYGKLPKAVLIMETLLLVKKRVSEIEWKIQFN